MAGFKIKTKNAAETVKIARVLAEKIERETIPRNRAIVLALSGNLGSGKTTFVQGFAKALGTKQIPKSPTFILMQAFSLPTTNNKQQTTTLIHIDCYRLNNHREILRLGLKEILADPHNIVVIEWAEKIKKLLPKDAVWIKFEHAGGNKRHITIKP